MTTFRKYKKQQFRNGGLQYDQAKQVCYQTIPKKALEKGYIVPKIKKTRTIGHKLIFQAHFGKDAPEEITYWLLDVDTEKMELHTEIVSDEQYEEATKKISGQQLEMWQRMYPPRKA